MVAVVVVVDRSSSSLSEDSLGGILYSQMFLCVGRPLAIVLLLNFFSIVCSLLSWNITLFLWN